MTKQSRTEPSSDTAWARFSFFFGFCVVLPAPSCLNPPEKKGPTKNYTAWDARELTAYSGHDNGSRTTETKKGVVVATPKKKTGDLCGDCHVLV